MTKNDTLHLLQLYVEKVGLYISEGFVKKGNIYLVGCGSL